MTSFQPIKCKYQTNRESARAKFPALVISFNSSFDWLKRCQRGDGFAGSRDRVT